MRPGYAPKRMGRIHQSMRDNTENAGIDCRIIGSLKGARSLAARCKRHDHPIVVVTRLAPNAWPYRPERMAAELGMEVAGIEDGAPLDEFNALMAPRETWGGATRLFRADGTSRFWKRDKPFRAVVHEIDDSINGERRQRDLKRDNDALRSALADARAERDALKGELKAARAAAFDPEGLFADGEEQLRFEVTLQWAKSIPASDKAGMPLARYRLDPGFLDTVRRYAQSVGRDALVRAIVDVLDGVAERSKGRRAHTLREGRGTNDRDRLSEYRTPIWRINVTTRNGFRLHYTTDESGTIVLLGLYAHDELL